MSTSMFNRSRMLMASAGIAAILAGAAAVATVPVGPKAVAEAPPRRSAVKRSLFGGFARGRTWGKRARRGWSPRQVQRMAVKRRNKARARRAKR